MKSAWTGGCLPGAGLVEAWHQRREVQEMTWGAGLGAWQELVNRPQSQNELDALVRCIQRGCPFGREDWGRRMAAEWNIESTLRPRGRPKKTRKGS